MKIARLSAVRTRNHEAMYWAWSGRGSGLKSQVSANEGRRYLGYLFLHAAMACSRLTDGKEAKN